MEKKCSNCGSKNLIKADGRYKPFEVRGDADLTFLCDVFMCAECGHYEFFSDSNVEEIKSLEEFRDSIRKEIEQLNGRITELQNIKFDPKPFEVEIKKLNDELKTLKSLSVGGKDIKWREDAIKENRKIIESRVDPKIDKEINDLKLKVDELRKRLK